MGNLVSWGQQSFNPVKLPGRKLPITLRDAAKSIVKLPKAEQEATEWQAAAEMLMLIGEHVDDRGVDGQSLAGHPAQVAAPQHQQRRAAS